MESRAGGVAVDRGTISLNSSHGVDGGATRNLLQQSQSQLLAGGVATAIAKTCTSPLARLTIRFQVQGMHSNVVLLSKPNMWKEASRIVNEEGVRVLWKGNMVTVIHHLSYFAANFYAFEHFKKLLQSFPSLRNDDASAGKAFALRFVSGGLTGITAASATYPLDLVRTRLAAQCTIAREEGFVGLYKGLGATLLGVGPSLAISFSVYETLRSYWQSQGPDDSTVTTSIACGSLSGLASSSGDSSTKS